MRRTRADKSIDAENPLADPRLILEAQLPEGIHLRTAGGELIVFTVRSPEKTTANEDAAAIIPLQDSALVLAVADGVGGLPAGAWASATTVETLERACRAASQDNDIRDVLLSGVEEANRRILDSGNGSATTLAMVEIQGGRVRTFHAGDSMVLLCGQRGHIGLETLMHSPTGYAVEAGILTEEDAIHHEDRHLVSNVLGSRSLHLSISMPVMMKRHDTLLLATDGLVDNIQKDLIIETIRKGPLPVCGRRLCELALERMTSRYAPYKPDDLTCILYRRTN